MVRLSVSGNTEESAKEYTVCAIVIPYKKLLNKAV